jgi:predicted nucleic acid-binding protein
MNVLIDTNLLVYSVESTTPNYETSVAAMAALRISGATLCLVPQVFYEFWVVSTRPTANNGRGRTPSEVAAEFAFLKSRLTVFPDSQNVLDEWERLVTTHGIVGKPAHDTRLVAAMLTHNISHLLTFNVKDFTRYPGITILDPNTVAATPPSSTP